MERPSGDHFALSASVEMLVSFFALLVAPVAGSKSASHICLPVLSTGKEEHGVPVGGELQAAVVGLGYRQRNRLTACNGLQPQLRCFGVLVEIHGCNSVGQPFAVRRDGGVSEALHVHHVLEGHGAFRRGFLGRRERNGKEDEYKEEGERRFAHKSPARAQVLLSPVPNTGPRAPSLYAKEKFTPAWRLRNNRSRAWNGIPPEIMKMQPRILHYVQDDRVQGVGGEFSGQVPATAGRLSTPYASLWPAQDDSAVYGSFVA